MSNDSQPLQENMYYPTDMHRFLRLEGNSSAVMVSKVSHAPINLPQTADHSLDPVVVSEEGLSKEVLKVGKTLKSGWFVYPVVFVIAFVFFYSILNFGALFDQIGGWFVAAEDEQILGEDLTEYYAWMGGYFFAVRNKESLEPAGDIDRDGLSNMDEFVIRTNPTIADSDSDGFSDGIELINSTSPWGNGGFTEQQRKLAETLDLIKISNRISYNSAVIIRPSESSAVLGTNKINYDLNRAGRLSIPKLNLQVPVIWTKDPKDFDSDLAKGVVHYPGTALPGEQGIVYVSGHSSDYPWKKHPYKQIFARLNALEVGDDIFIDIYGVDGKTYNYRYRVTSENTFRPDDQAQFIDNSAAKLNLSTCWPIGTTKDRLVVSAVLQSL